MLTIDPVISKVLGKVCTKLEWIRLSSGSHEHLLLVKPLQNNMPPLRARADAIVPLASLENTTEARVVGLQNSSAMCPCSAVLAHI